MSASIPVRGRALQRRSLLALAPVLLAGCGFQLRQAPDFVFSQIIINAPNSSGLANELRRNLLSTGRVQVVEAAAPVAAAAPAAPASVPAASPGTVALDVLLEQREKVVVGLNATGQVREFQLRTRLRFRVRTPAARDLIPETELLQQRDISFNEAAVLAKEAEEQLLYRDMQTDLVQQLMRRLAALKGL